MYDAFTEQTIKCVQENFTGCYSFRDRTGNGME